MNRRNDLEGRTIVPKPRKGVSREEGSRMLQGDYDAATDLHNQEVLMARRTKPHCSDLRSKGRDRMTVINCVPGLGIKRDQPLGSNPETW